MTAIHRVDQSPSTMAFLRAVWSGTIASSRRIRQVYGSSVQKESCVHTNGIVRALEGSQTDEHTRGEELTFGEIFRNSKFVQTASPVGKKVRGEIIAVVNDNVYVDFGCKFHAVVAVPQAKPEFKGRKVEVLVHDLEITDHFLGDSKDTSLLEAEAEIVRFCTD